MTNKLNYPLEDHELLDNELEAKYGDAGHPYYTLEKWRELQANGGDAHFNGYWDYVSEMIDQDDIPGDPEGNNLQDDPHSEMINVESMEQFAHFVTTWHGNKVNMLKHMRDIPEGTAVEITSETGEPVKMKLEGDTMTGFKLGLTMALLEFEKLPFNVSQEDDAEPQSN